MAELKIILENSTYKVNMQGFYWEFPAGSPDNEKALILFLRGFKKRGGAKHGLFTQGEIAKAIPGFKGTTKQSIEDHQSHFEESGKNIRWYLNRKRKVDEEVVEAIAKELEGELLANKTELAKGVNERLGRKDITEANIEAGLEQISAKRLRKIMKKQFEKGKIHYKEEYLLEMSFSALESAKQKTMTKALNVLDRAKIKGTDKEEGMKLLHPSEQTLKDLLEPDKELSEIPLGIKLVVFCLVLYGHGVPLRVLGKWIGVDKTTVLRWILGLSEALWEKIAQWIAKGVKGIMVYLDEKWIKIRGKWHYWFVAMDKETELPIVQELMSKRSGWNCLWIVAKVKKMGLNVKVFITDGLRGYPSAIAGVFKNAIHQLCLFHHQQNVSKYVRENFQDEQEKEDRKKHMKKLFQTNDKRTVRNRLEKLKEKAQAWAITEWLTGVMENLPHLLPAVGSLRIPRTSNAIERFFCAFNRFYKIRRGFHSLKSAKRQLILFMVFYLFTEKEDGIAPVERIIPEARRMPLYLLMNDPFTSLGLGFREVKQNCSFAENRMEKVA